MPSKRQPSKQRKAAQNRATRAQLEARRQRAGELASSAPADVGADDGAPTEDGGDAAANPVSKPGGLFSGMFGGRQQPAAGSQPAGRGWVATRPDGTRLPGARAAFVALVLALTAFAFLLFTPTIDVDDRDELMPLEFQGLYLEARAMLTGDPVEVDQVSLLSFVGPGAILMLIIPLAIVVYAYWAHRKTGGSRPLTLGMLFLAVLVFLMSAMAVGGISVYFIPAMIALAVASFQARKAELPARMAERVVRDRDEEDDVDVDADDVIDVDSVEADRDDDDVDDDDVDDDEFEYEYEDEADDLDSDKDDSVDDESETDDEPIRGRGRRRR